MSCPPTQSVSSSEDDRATGPAGGEVGGRLPNGASGVSRGQSIQLVGRCVAAGEVGAVGEADLVQGGGTGRPAPPALDPVKGTRS